MNELLFSKETFLGISCILIIIAALLFSCNSSNMKSQKEREDFVKDYLQNRYSTEFELISLNRENAVGDKFRHYSAKLRSLSYDRRIFYVTFTIKKGEEPQINIDQFPIILLEEAFLKELNIEKYKEFPMAFEIEGTDVNGNYLAGINNLEDARNKLNSIGDSAWNLFIYIIVNNPEKQIKEIENVLVNLLGDSYEILPARSSADVFIYGDTSLTQGDIQPDMNKGVVTRTPHKDKLFGKWIMAWTPNNLNKYDNGFKTVVEKRRNIPVF